MKTISTTVEKIKNTYVCEFCGKEFGRKKDCESHEDLCHERAVVLTNEVNRLTEEYARHYIVSINRYHDDDYVMKVTIPKSFEMITNESYLYPADRRLVINETYDEYVVRAYTNRFCEQSIQFDQTMKHHYRDSKSSYNPYPGMVILEDRIELETFFGLFVGLYNMYEDDKHDKHIKDICENLVYYYNKYKGE